MPISCYHFSSGVGLGTLWTKQEALVALLIIPRTQLLYCVLGGLHLIATQPHLHSGKVPWSSDRLSKNVLLNIKISQSNLRKPIFGVLWLVNMNQPIEIAQLCISDWSTYLLQSGMCTLMSNDEGLTDVDTTSVHAFTHALVSIVRCPSAHAFREWGDRPSTPCQLKKILYTQSEKVYLSHNC